ncbi:isoprenoid synthase domain-containing protein [Aspergillus filifer]
MRDKFIDTLNLWLHVSPGSLQRIKDIVQMLYNASLMLDDVEDISSLRRGQPATHIFYGPSQTVNSANFVYVKTVHEITRLHNPKCMEIFIDSYPLNHTGGLFRLMLRLLEAESLISLPSSLLLSRLLTLTGRYYQIRDDYLNLTSEDYTSKKGFCKDLDKGKLSLPLIHLLKHTAHPGRFLTAIYKRPLGSETHLQPEIKTAILAGMEEAGSFEYTRDVLRYLHAELIKQLNDAEDKLGRNTGARMLLLGLGLV